MILSIACKKGSVILDQTNVPRNCTRSCCSAGTRNLPTDRASHTWQTKCASLANRVVAMKMRIKTRPFFLPSVNTSYYCCDGLFRNNKTLDCWLTPKLGIGCNLLQLFALQGRRIHSLYRLYVLLNVTKFNVWFGCPFKHRSSIFDFWKNQPMRKSIHSFCLLTVLLFLFKF